MPTETPSRGRPARHAPLGAGTPALTTSLTSRTTSRTTSPEPHSHTGGRTPMHRTRRSRPARRARLRLAALAVIAGAAALGACSADRAAAPAGPDASGTVAGDTAPLVQVNALTRTASLDGEYVASVLVTPDSGGYLQIPDAGLLVYAPPGAVADTVTIWAKALPGSS